MAERTLVIMRHGKAEQSATKRDADRALEERGHRDAHAGGLWLAQQGIHPDLVLVSPALRTRITWHEVAVAFADAGAPVTPAVTYEAGLYDGGISGALDILRAVRPEAKTVLLIGHNPTVSALSQRLDDVRARPAGGLRTSGIAVHAVDADWAQLAAAPLTDEHTPRA